MDTRKDQSDIIQKGSRDYPYWPEAVRDQPRRDKFPWSTLILSLLPGLVIISLLVTPLFWLQGQSRKNIVYLGSDGQINMIEADNDNPQVIANAPLQLNTEIQGRLQEVLPVLGLPYWSSIGLGLATLTTVNNNVQVAVFFPITGTVTLLSSVVNDSNILVAPSDGWSVDGHYLALIETDGQNPFISLVDFKQNKPVIIPINLPLDIRAGLSWHPRDAQFLITTLADGSSPSTIQVVTMDGKTTPIVPKDGQFLRTDAVWSPTGQQIAYIVVDPIQQEKGLAGSLWVADSDGESAQLIVGDGLNMAPIWDPKSPDFIYFTRLITNTNSYDLYRVNPNSPSSIQRVGNSHMALIEYPFDRQSFLQWSDTGQLLSILAQPRSFMDESNWTPNMIMQATIRQSVPMLGIPHWSPNGDYLTTVQWRNGKMLPTIYDSDGQTTIALESVFDVMAAPSDGWSYDSQVVAFVEFDGGRPLLTLLSAPDFDPAAAAAYNFTLDDRAGIDWDPTQPKLLVTGQVKETAPPSLFFVDASGQEQPFTPNDGYLVHADGAWSPDGSLVAYIASNTYTTTQDILPGELWLTDREGNSARSIVPDAQAIAPIWSPTGDAIYYISFMDTLGEFAWYRILADGTGSPEYVGPGSEDLLLYPWDRNLFLQGSPDGQQAFFISETPLLPRWYADHAPNAEVIAQIRADLPIIGASQWSPDGQKFAGTILDEGNIRAVTFRTPTSPRLLSPATSDRIVFPADGWSPDSNYVAFLRYDGSTPRLSVMDTNQSSMGTGSFMLDLRAGISWNTNSTQIMATAQEGGVTPTLQIYTLSDNSSGPFVPDDDQLVHADGVWSPSGTQIAYIASSNMTETLAMEFLAGSLWIADEDGHNTQQLVPDGLNFAPMWDGGQRIIFTRFITQTNSFALFQVDTNEAIVEQLGAGSPLFAEYPFDRSLFKHWSPEGLRWLLPGAAAARPSIYHLMGTNLPMSLLPTDCSSNMPFIVHWAPTSRGILIACPNQGMFLRWLGSNLNDKIYPDGEYPSWQP